MPMSYQQCGEFLGRHGSAEVIPLPLGAVMRLQESELLLRFDALGHDSLLEARAHRNDRTDGGLTNLVVDSLH